MAVRLFAHEVSDLCLGKPALRSISVANTVGDGLSSLKRLGEGYLSVWSCNHSFVKPNLRKTEQGEDKETGNCRCIGKVCMVDVICYLCNPENLASPATALQSPISVLIPENNGLVKHLEPNASLLDAIELMLEGVQNLVIPIQSPINTRKRQLQKNSSFDSTFHNNNLRFCWLSQEDVIRYLLNSIGLFSPTSSQPINTLDVIGGADIVSAVYYEDPASSAVSLIKNCLVNQTSVAIVDIDGKLIGEISPATLNSFDEAVAAAVATLSAGDLMAYIDCGGPPEDLVQLVKERLEKRNLGAALELLGEESGLSSWSSFSSTSSDDELGGGMKNGKVGGYSARVVRRSEAIICYPWSSLVAVMIQALAHRVSYVWVVEEDGKLSGIVTFPGILKVFRGHVKGGL